MEMGIGIDTGPAVVGNMGSLRRIKYGVVGHIVGAWEAAGKPDLSKPRPPRGPQRKRAPRPPTP